MLKLVIDTNVLVLALISTKGNPALLLDKAGKSYTRCISKDILNELEAVISREKFRFSDQEVNTLIEAIVSFSEIVNPQMKLDVVKWLKGLTRTT